MGLTWDNQLAFLKWNADGGDVYVLNVEQGTITQLTMNHQTFKKELSNVSNITAVKHTNGGADADRPQGHSE